MLTLLILVLLYFILFLFDIKTLKLCDKAVSNDPFILQYFSDRYKTQKICDKTVDNFLQTLKFVPDWFVINKMIKKLDDALITDDDILFFG